LTIEDSCDSLIENNKDLFPNLGDYEIISLSKIMNSISGGIILHNKNAIKINNQKSNTRFNFTSEMKFGRKLIRAFFPRYNWKPLCFEHLNHALSHVEVAHIRTCLKNYHRNLQLIRHRLITIENLCGDKFNRFSNRIGPGVVVEFHENKIDAVESSLPPKSLIRHFDTSLSNDKDASYKKIVYLPLHANIDHETFEKFEDFINRNLFQIGSVY
jgi:hypothetical protein